MVRPAASAVGTRAVAKSAEGSPDFVAGTALKRTGAFGCACPQSECAGDAFENLADNCRASPEVSCA